MVELLWRRMEKWWRYEVKVEGFKWQRWRFLGILREREMEVREYEGYGVNEERMGIKVNLYGEIRRWNQAPTVRFLKKLHHCASWHGRVSATLLKDTGCVHPKKMIFSAYSTQGLTRAVSPDTGTRVKPLETHFLTHPWHILTRAMSADMGARVRPLISHFPWFPFLSCGRLLLPNFQRLFATAIFNSSSKHCSHLQVNNTQPNKENN